MLPVWYAASTTLQSTQALLLSFNDCPTAPQQRCIEHHQKCMEASLQDELGMTPFHVLCWTCDPSGELLQVLLDTHPVHVVDWKDANGKRPLEYLISNWTETTASLLELILPKEMSRQPFYANVPNRSPVGQDVDKFQLLCAV